MLNYLVMGQDGAIGGYDRADILLCDYAVHSRADHKPLAIWRRTDELQSRFAPSSLDEVRADLAAANVCRECGGKNGHASPFCSLLDLTETLEMIA